MKFIVSSTTLLTRLQSIDKVISSKSPMAVLDNFLFKVEGERLEMTASDLETTMTTSMPLSVVEGEGSVAIPAKLLTDYLRRVPEEPITFEIDFEENTIKLNTETGGLSMRSSSWEEFPSVPTLESDANVMLMPSDLLLYGIAKTLYATGNDEIRAVLTGVYFDITPDNITFVGSDSHILVRYRREVSFEKTGSFILPKKPANLIKSLLGKINGDVEMQFDQRNALFKLGETTLVCRLVEGNFPSYNEVIPTDNPNKVRVDRLEFLSKLRRVAVSENQATNLVKLEFGDEEFRMSAQDWGYSTEGEEKVSCHYEGEKMAMGFKSTYLDSILSNINATDVVIEMGDPQRAALIMPVQAEFDGEDTLVLIMPQTLNENSYNYYN